MKKMIKDKKKSIIYAIGDLHIGNMNYNDALFKTTLNKIWNDKDAYIIGMGDYCEFIHKRSFAYESQIITPGAQWKKFKKLFKRFAEAGRILTLLRGNHEDRYFKKVDALEDYCERYDIVYNGRHCVIDAFNKVMYVTHPRSGATTTAGRARIYQRMKNVQEANIYLAGHFHSLYQEIGYTYNKDGILIPTWFACTGSFLDYRNSYAEERLYSPNPCGCKKITIYETGKIEIGDFL